MALCQLLLSPSNFLILDEPTNHLDIQSKEVLKNALKNYEGTFVVVSHDREFLEGLTTRIWEIEDQQLRVHHYGVKEFLQRKSAPAKPAQKPKQVDTPKKDTKTTNLSYEEEKELKRRKNKWRNQVKRAEDAIGKEIKAIGRKFTVIGVFVKEGSSIVGDSMDEIIIVPVNYARSIMNLRSERIQPFIQLLISFF